jgi:hypothetical protein
VFEVILRLYAIRHGKPYCGEKTPGHWRHTESLLGDFPNAKIIFMIRDGRDAALSLAGMPWWPYDLSAAAAVWRGAAEAARAFLASYPTRVTVVRYEDIVSSPQTILAALMEFVELPFEPRQLDTDVVSHVVLPRSVQWKGRALGPIDQSRVGHWHSAARPQEASCLADALGAEMAFFGYH